MAENDVSIILFFRINLIAVHQARLVGQMGDYFLYGPVPVVHQDGIARRERFDLLPVIMVFQVQGGGEISAVSDPVRIFDGKTERAVTQVNFVMIGQRTDVRGMRARSYAQSEQQDEHSGQTVIAFHGDIPPIDQ